MPTEERKARTDPIPPKLSIVFINYNVPEMLKGALRTLAENMPAFPFELVVVDNASKERFPLDSLPHYFQAQRAGSRSGSDEDLMIKSSFTGIRWINNLTNRGYGPAANQGIAVARGNYVAIAGADIEFLPGTLDRLVEFLEGHPEAGAVSPQLLWADRTPQPTARRFPALRYVLSGRRSPLSRLLPNRPRAQEFVYAGIENNPGPVAVEAVIGAFLVAPRKLLDELGGFDEQYFFYVEDVDLCRRMARAGKLIYVLPQALMIHYLGSSRRRRGSFAEFQRIRSFYRYFRTSYFRLPSALFLFLFTCYLALIAGGSLLGIREWEYAMKTRGESQ